MNVTCTRAALRFVRLLLACVVLTLVRAPSPQVAATDAIVLIAAVAPKAGAWSRISKPSRISRPSRISKPSRISDRGTQSGAVLAPAELARVDLAALNVHAPPPPSTAAPQLEDRYLRHCALLC